MGHGGVEEVREGENQMGNQKKEKENGKEKEKRKRKEKKFGGK